ncbi:MAG: hypothetical protein JW395_2182 [Nitrospira sp.]|nr:hypothetical protein [Nitrospira sp.]
MSAQTSTIAHTAPISGSTITDYLPAEHWATELIYHCILSHEERVQQFQASTPAYDPQSAYRVIEASRSLLERHLEKAGLVGTKRDLAFAYWDRGLQQDAIESVRAGFAEKVRDNIENKNVLRQILELFIMGARVPGENGVGFYGGASCCLHVAHSAGLSANELIKEALLNVQTATSSST